MRSLHPRQLILTAIICFCSITICGQEDTRFRKISEFLKTNWEVRTETNELQFTGDYVALPEQLQNDLLSSFPKHRFSMAEMLSCGHLPCSPHKLIVITDAQSGEVVGFVRQLTWGHASKSFKYIFNAYQAKDRKEIEGKLGALVKLIALTHRAGNVGKSRIQKDTISVELLWGEGVWRIIEAKFDGRLRIKRVSLIDGRNGRRLA